MNSGDLLSIAVMTTSGNSFFWSTIGDFTAERFGVPVKHYRLIHAEGYRGEGPQ